MSGTCDSDRVAEADGSLMPPEILSPTHHHFQALPDVGKVLHGAPVGKDVEEAQELPVNPPRGGHDTRQKGCVVPCLLAYASRYRARGTVPPWRAQCLFVYYSSNCRGMSHNFFVVDIVFPWNCGWC